MFLYLCMKGVSKYLFNINSNLLNFSKSSWNCKNYLNQGLSYSRYFMYVAILIARRISYKLAKKNI